MKPFSRLSLSSTHPYQPPKPYQIHHHSPLFLMNHLHFTPHRNQIRQRHQRHLPYTSNRIISPKAITMPSRDPIPIFLILAASPQKPYSRGMKVRSLYLLLSSYPPTATLSGTIDPRQPPLSPLKAPTTTSTITSDKLPRQLHGVGANSPSIT